MPSKRKSFPSRWMMYFVAEGSTLVCKCWNLMNHLWMSQEVLDPSGTDHDDTFLLQIIRTIWRLFFFFLSFIIVLDLKISIKM